MNASIICFNSWLLFSDADKVLNVCTVIVTWGTGRNQSVQWTALSSYQSNLICQTSYLIPDFEKKPDSGNFPFDTPAITCRQEKRFERI